MKYIVSIDCSSSACKSSLITTLGEVVKFSSVPISSSNPKEGWIEHDPQEIWEKQLKSLENLLEGIDPSLVMGIGITNQRETVVAWDRRTHNPVYPAISWQDKRNSEFLDLHKKNEGLIIYKTGLVLDTYFSAPKIKWILDNAKYDLSNLYVGTVDSWLIYNLTKHEVFATDVSNASRTLLFNINTLAWDEELLDMFQIPKNILPSVKSSADLYGFWEFKSHKIPICGVIGDQQASLITLGGDTGVFKCTYGTGNFLLSSLGKEKKIFEGFLTTVAWKIKDQEPMYALENGMFVCGNVVEKERQRYGSDYLISDPDILEDAFYLPTSNKRIFTFDRREFEDRVYNSDPSESWNKRLKAMCNGIALAVNDSISKVRKIIPVREIWVNGKLANLDYLNKAQAFISSVDVYRTEFSNHSSLGAAYLVGLYYDLYSLNDLKNLGKPSFTVFKPNQFLFSKTKILENWLN